MEANFNNDIEVMETFENHKHMSNGKIAAMVIIGSVICAGVIKGVDWFRKRKQAKEQVETEDIETTEEK